MVSCFHSRHMAFLVFLQETKAEITDKNSGKPLFLSDNFKPESCLKSDLLFLFGQRITKEGLCTRDKHLIL